MKSIKNLILFFTLNSYHYFFGVVSYFWLCFCFLNFNFFWLKNNTKNWPLRSTQDSDSFMSFLYLLCYLVLAYMAATHQCLYIWYIKSTSQMFAWRTLFAKTTLRCCPKWNTYETFNCVCSYQTKLTPLMLNIICVWLSMS